ncbi:MAG: hypothetical protein J5476_12655 [Lachnospiraceae bacterium]|nr:hypothetical protein [Lachnospiraceae bacterium]
MATAKKTTGKSTSTSKKTTAKKTTAKKPAAKKPATTAKKTTGSRIQVNATEKKLVELYRAADSDTKKAALALLKGEKTQTSGILSSILGDSDLLNNLSNIIPGANLFKDMPE